MLFLLFWVRVNELHKYYASKNNDDIGGFIGSVKKWGRDLFWYIPEVYILNPKSITQKQLVSESPNFATNENLSNEKRIKHLENSLRKISKDLHEMKREFKEDLRISDSNTGKKIGELESEQRSAEKETSELQLKNLGREFVALSWLIVAALVNSI